MTPDEVLILLQVAQTYDSRNIDRLMQAAWHDAATRARWDRDAALDAIRAHYAESTERIMPGHVTARLRLARPIAPPVAERLRALSAAPPPSENRRGEIRAMFGFARRTQEPQKPGSRRRWRTNTAPTDTDPGPEPQRAFSGNLAGIIRRRGEGGPQ